MEKFDKIMIETAQLWAKMSYCKRLQVGAVLAKEGRILATAYNGTISGYKNICEEMVPDKNGEILCTECNGNGIITNNIPFPYNETFVCSECKGSGHFTLLNRTNEYTLHAEQNIITFCAKNGIRTEGTTLYLTHSPCKQCAKLIVQSGIERVIYKEKYRDEEAINFINRFIKIEQFKS